jgi:transcriptional regulator with XRE-family HTH domain
LTSKGLSVADVAGRLRTSRQYVNQTRQTAEAKLSKALMEVARVNDLQVAQLHPKEALLIGYHPVLKRKAVVTYTTSHGIKVWYWHDNPEEETDHDFLKQAREYLLDLAKERDLEIEDATRVHPAELARIVFRKLVPEAEL